MHQAIFGYFATRIFISPVKAEIVQISVFHRRHTTYGYHVAYASRFTDGFPYITVSMYYANLDKEQIGMSFFDKT